MATLQEMWDEVAQGATRLADTYIYTGLGAADDARIAAGRFNDSEKLVMASGATAAEAVRLVKKYAGKDIHSDTGTKELSATVQFLIRKGTPPAEAVEFVKTPLNSLETALIMNGAPAVKARQWAAMPISMSDVNTLIGGLVDSGTREENAFKQGAVLKAELHDPSMTRKGEQTPVNISRAHAFDRLLHSTHANGADVYAAKLASYIVDPYKPTPAPTAPAHEIPADAVVAAVATGGDVTRIETAGVVATAATNTTTGSFQPTLAKGSVSQAHPANALIMKALKGDALADGEAETVQSHLKEQRFDAGKVDGKLGAKTWEAIARYAKAGHLTGEKVDNAHLKHMEASLKAIGYAHIKVDGNIKDDSETKRALGKFFDIRAALNDLKPTDVTNPDIAAMAAVQVGDSTKRGLVASKTK